MVDRVELVALHEPQQVRDLDRSRPRRARAAAPCRPTKSFRSGTCAITLFADQQVRAPALVGEACRELAPEELHDGVDAALAGGLGDVRGGLDAERGMPRSTTCCRR